MYTAYVQYNIPTASGGMHVVFIYAFFYVLTRHYCSTFYSFIYLCFFSSIFFPSPRLCNKYVSAVQTNWKRRTKIGLPRRDVQQAPPVPANSVLQHPLRNIIYSHGVKYNIIIVSMYNIRCTSYTDNTLCRWNG